MSTPKSAQMQTMILIPLKSSRCLASRIKLLTMCGFNARNAHYQIRALRTINTHNQIRIAICRGFYTGVFKNPFTPPGVLLFNPPPSRGFGNYGWDTCWLRPAPCTAKLASSRNSSDKSSSSPSLPELEGDVLTLLLHCVNGAKCAEVG